MELTPKKENWEIVHLLFNPSSQFSREAGPYSDNFLVRPSSVLYNGHILHAVPISTTKKTTN
jgi:hypothetical protein